MTFQPYVVLENLTLLTASTLKPNLMMDNRQSRMIDSTRHESRTASSAMRSHT